MMKTEALMRLSGAAITTAALSFLSSPVQAAPNAQEARFLATLLEGRGAAVLVVMKRRVRRRDSAPGESETSPEPDAMDARIDAELADVD